MSNGNAPLDDEALGKSFLERWLDYEAAATARARHVMLILQVFGLFCLVVWANTRSDDWFTQRVSLASDAQALIACDAQHASKYTEKIGTNRKPIACKSGAGCKALAAGWAAECTASMKSLEPEAATRAAIWMLEMKYTAYDVTEISERAHQNAGGNAYLVSIPLTGMKIDPNDFGPLAALAHLSLLIWLWLSLDKCEKLELQRDQIFERTVGESKPVAEIYAYLEDASSFFSPDHNASTLAWTLHAVASAIAINIALIPLFLVTYPDFVNRELFTSVFPHQRFSIHFEGIAFVLNLVLCFFLTYKAIAISNVGPKPEQQPEQPNPTGPEAAAEVATP